MLLLLFYLNIAVANYMLLPIMLIYNDYIYFANRMDVNKVMFSGKCLVNITHCTNKYNNILITYHVFSVGLRGSKKWVAIKLTGRIVNI